MRFFCIFFLCLFCFVHHVPAQPGCTDPQASNYNPAATTNNGSCVYPTTNYMLSTKSALSTSLNETSGLIMANGVVWTHNDSGNAAAIYQVDTTNGAVLKTVTVGGATNVDWEDIAFDGTNFYIGDFGNNANGNRTDLKIYKFPYSAIPAGTNVTVPAGQVQVINFSYEDQTNFSGTGSNNTSFDCEAMIYWDGALHLFTKDWVNHYTVHYVLPTAAGTYAALNQETFFANGLVTGADITAQGVIVLLGYQSAGGPLFFWLLFDYQTGEFFSGNKRRIELGSFLLFGQAEGICFRNTAYGYVSNEKVSVLVPARLYSFQVSQWLQPAFLPVELKRFEVRPTAAGALLEWETASEHSNAGFSVERSDGGVLFRAIAFVPGAGNSAEPRAYTFLDSGPPEAVIRYYRLRQRDLDGSEILSPVVALWPSKVHSCRLVQNPVPLGCIPTLVAHWAENDPVRIRDIWGRDVWTGEYGQLARPLHSPGIYTLQISDRDGRSVCTATFMVE